MEEAVSMEVVPNDNMVLNTTESGIVLATVEVESAPEEVFVVVLEAAAKPLNCQTDKRWGTINVAAGVSIPYSGCAGGKTKQKDDEFWNRLFPKKGLAKVDPRGAYTLEDGSPFETGRDAALREFREETLGAWDTWMVADPVMKEFRVPGGYSGKWKDKKTGQILEFHSSVTVLHVHIVLPSRNGLINVMESFEHNCLLGLVLAEKQQEEGASAARIHQTRPEYRRMHLVPKQAYWSVLMDAALHLRAHRRGGRPFDGRATWVDTWPTMASLIAIRKWDLYILMKALLESDTPKDLIDINLLAHPLYAYLNGLLDKRTLRGG